MGDSVLCQSLRSVPHKPSLFATLPPASRAGDCCGLRSWGSATLHPRLYAIAALRGLKCRRVWSSTRSGGMNLARRFNAGEGSTRRSRRVATPDKRLNRRYATGTIPNLSPALKGRAKLIPTLRVEHIIRAFLFATVNTMCTWCFHSWTLKPRQRNSDSVFLNFLA